jgi:hypothetical protein
MPISTSQFALLRRSNPAAAFDVLVRDFLMAVRTDREMAAAFTSFQMSFKGSINTSEDAGRLAVLKEQGAEQMGIQIGTMPWSMSAGLVFLYDAAIEGLQASDEFIDPQKFGPDTIRTAERLLEPALLQIGQSAVTALELAMISPAYADKLRARTKEVDWVALQPPQDPTLCEHCTIIEEDAHGNPISTYCPTKEECDNLGGLFILLLMILLVLKILDWLF